MRLCLFNVLLIMCTNCPENFYNKVLQSINERHGYFISVTVEDNKGQREVVVENDDLYLALSNRKKITENDYRSLMKNVLDNNKVLSLGSTTVDESSGFYEIKTCLETDEIAKKGKDYFIKNYFKNGVLKDPVSDTELHCLIKQLFKWCILAKVDDESGLLVIEEL